MKAYLLLSALVVAASHAAAQQTGASAKALTWGPAPAVFPAGAAMAVVSGDPTKSGEFTVQFEFPDGYRIPPHTHPTDEKATIKSGTFVVGMGDKFDASKAKPMTPGQTGVIPAGTAHFAQAKGKTVVEITSQGPFAMTYVNPKDDPTKKTTP